MLPGKPFTPADALTILRRRAWLFVLPAIVCLGLAAGVASRMPDRYRSETVILVVPQRVPESFVRSTVTVRIEDRLRTIMQQILSRTRLEQMIKEFDLYPDLRRRKPLDDVTAIMRDDVSVDTVKSDSFRVSFEYTDRVATMRVTERLASLFIDDNLREREAQANSTSQFLISQLEEARGRLVQQEKRLEMYRRAHEGELPSQLPSNLQIIQSTNTQIQSLTETLNRDRDRRAAVDRLIGDIAMLPPRLPAATAPRTSDAALSQMTTERQLEIARQELRSLETRLTSQHPDVVRARRRVQELEAQRAAEQAKEPQSKAASVVPSDVDPSQQSRLIELRAERATLDRQIETRSRELERLEGVVQQYQARIEAVPTRESELTAITRDYDTVLATYRDLLAKKEQSQIAADLERRQIGEQFRVIDPAALPERPFSPKRPLIAAIGGGMGLVLGVLLAAFLEIRDSSLKTEADVEQTLQLPVLALIPTVVTPLERRRRRRRTTMIAAAAALCIVAVGIAAVMWIHPV